jgi:thiamine biosynthesis lipoprotein
MAALAPTACRKKPEVPLDRHQSLTIFDRVHEITLPFVESDSLPLAVQTLRSIATRNRDLLNPADPRSELFLINQIGGGRAFPVSEETHRILLVCKRLSERTRGAFDITAAPLAQLWGFEGGTVPSEPVPDRVLQAARGSVGNHLLDVAQEATQVRLQTDQTRIALGEIETSYTLDLTIIQLRQRGVENILIDAGTMARSQGSRGPDDPWQRTIEDPFVLGRTLGTADLDSGFGAASISRNDRFVLIGGEHVNAVVDPRTGHPAEGTAAVYVFAPSATDATALAQALFVVGVEEAPRILLEFPRAHVLIIPDREPLGLWMTEGFEERFQLAPDMTAVMHRLGVDSSFL